MTSLLSQRTFRCLIAAIRIAVETFRWGPHIRLELVIFLPLAIRGLVVCLLLRSTSIFMMLTDQEVARALVLELAFESLLRSVNFHDNFILAFRVQQIIDRELLRWMPPQETRKDAPSIDPTTSRRGQRSTQLGVRPRSQSKSYSVWTQCYAHTENLLLSSQPTGPCLSHTPSSSIERHSMTTDFWHSLIMKRSRNARRQYR